MLRRDDAVEAQREHERLAYKADRTARSIERLLAATEERLAALVAPGSPLLPVPEPPDEGLDVTITPTGIAATSRLLFRPYVPPSAEAPSWLFTEGEAAEFQSSNLRQAAMTYDRLAQSNDLSVRAAALLRLGRVLRASARQQGALDAYARMLALDDVRVAGLPADLLARAVRLHVLAHMGEPGRCSCRC